MDEAIKDPTNGLLRLRTGDAGAEQVLFQRVYDELRQIAARLMRGQRTDHTLQATALVHEVYVRLIDQDRVHAGDRTRFLALAARAMRSVLVDHARRRSAEKRGGAGRRLPLDKALNAFESRSTDLPALHDALADLAAVDSRQAQIVEMRFFGGMTNEEIGDFLGLSLRTVEREWRVARAWLRRELGPEPPSADQGDGSRSNEPRE